jgi:glucose/arabinose dehydrogenase
MIRQTIAGLALLLSVPALAEAPRSGDAAYGDWRGDAPGVVRHITPDALPPPYASSSASRFPAVVEHPEDAALRVPAGFRVTLFASGLDRPRTLRVAPNGDVFVAEAGAGRVRVLRGGDRPHPDGAAQPVQSTVFAGGLRSPFGIAFWPPGPDPRFVYVAATDKVVRFPYHSGDLAARGLPETVVPDLPTGGHWTRDVVFSPDGRRMFVAIGSDGNIATSLRGRDAAANAAWDAAHGLGAPWGDEAGRAQVRVFDPNGGDGRLYAAGLRNCAALAIQPATGAPWCAVNERDGLGDDLPPDYATELRQGAFYGWPWYYIGAHPDPRLANARPDLQDKLTVPEVLIQPHSAPLGIAFYDGPMFPPEYRGDAFVTLHGSWNRALRTGYKVIRLRFANGRPTGEYEDFLTGFVVSDRTVWGRPVGVTVAQDGALLVSEDANGTIWRVATQH